MRYILCCPTSLSFFLSFLLSLSSSNYSLQLQRAIFAPDYIQRRTQTRLARLPWTRDKPIGHTSNCSTSNIAKSKHPCPGVNRTHNPRKRATANLHLRPCGHRKRPSQNSQAETHYLPNISQKYYLLNKADRILVLIRDELDQSICKPFLQSATSSSEVLQHAVYRLATENSSP